MFYFSWLLGLETNLLSGFETSLLSGCQVHVHGNASVLLVNLAGVRDGAVTGVAHGGELIEEAVEEEEDAVVGGVGVWMWSMVMPKMAVLGTLISLFKVRRYWRVKLLLKRFIYLSSRICMVFNLVFLQGCIEWAVQSLIF